MINLVSLVHSLESNSGGNRLRLSLVQIARVQIEDAVLINQFSYATVANRHGQNLVIGDYALLDRLFERQVKKSFSVIPLTIHRKHIVAVSTKNPFGCCHENAMADIDLLISEKRSKSLGMHPYRLVGLVEDGEVELNACLSGRRSKLVATLVGREYNPGAIGTCAKQRRNLTSIRMRGQSEIIDFANKFIALKIADGFVTANTKPIWKNVVSEKFACPIGEALTDQRKAGNGNENGFCF